MNDEGGPLGLVAKGELKSKPGKPSRGLGLPAVGTPVRQPHEPFDWSGVRERKKMGSTV